MKKIIFTLATFVSMVATAQTPCTNGMAGNYPCSGYDLLSEMPASAFGASNANDSWGWTDPTTGSEYVLLGLDNGTAFLNIDDPVNPVYLGKLPTHTTSSIWRDIKTYGNYAFVVSEAGNHGMQVFDLTRLRNVTNPPQTFTEDAHYNGFGNAHNLVINEEVEYAYGVGTSTFNGGPHFVDISDPLNPTAAGGFQVDGYSHDGQVVVYNGPDADYAGREIYVGSNETEISIVDITNKSNPVAISTITYTNTAYTHQGWFTEDQKYFLLGDEIDEINFGFNTRTLVFDFSDLDNPQLSFEYSGATEATDHNGYVKGDNFYLANYAAGVRVIDISDIDNGNMTETGFFDMYTASDVSGYNGAWNFYPYFESGTLLVSTLSFSDPNFTPGMLLIREFNLGIEDNLTSEISIFPNPVSNVLTIASPTVQIETIALYDILGNQLFNASEISENKTTLDISNYASGVYLLNINENITKKVIKE